jgi:hypothetical protein
MTHLLSFKMTARSLTVAVLSERELIYIEVRKLAPNMAQARNSITALLRSLAAHFYIDSAAIMESEGETRAKRLSAHLLNELHALQLPHWPVKESTILSAYAEEPLSRTSALREAVANYWPHIIDDKSDKTCLDAAALGLYIQTERLLVEICGEAV